MVFDDNKVCPMSAASSTNVTEVSAHFKVLTATAVDFDRNDIHQIICYRKMMQMNPRGPFGANLLGQKH